MARKSESWARDLWGAAMAEHDWRGSVLEKVMFDWPSGKRSLYHPKPPAFLFIADQHGTVEEREYLDLQNALVQLGDERSRLGRRQHSADSPTIGIPFAPAPISQTDVEDTIRAVMASVHPVVVRQEQIMRCAFIAHLPEEIRRDIGTLSANLHPELPTPSKEYQRKGSRTMRARIDLGFGHPTSCEQVAGVLELKALTLFREIWFRKQLEKLDSTPPGMMFSGLAGDFQKLLDPKLPNNAFRFSWVVTKKRGHSTPDQVANWARRLLEPVERRLALAGFHQSYDYSMNCLRWCWGNGTALHLAWYWPKTQDPAQFEPVWMRPGNSNLT
jgi:hypothetical protein